MGIRRTPALLRCCITAFAVCMILNATHAHADPLRVALLTVLTDGVEVLATDATNWLPLRNGAQMPLLQGDSLRTNTSGRALVTLDLEAAAPADSAQLLLLPNSALAVDALTDTTLHLTQQGRTVVRMGTAPPFSDFRLATPALTITQPAAHFALQAEADAPATLIVASGRAHVLLGEREMDLSAMPGRDGTISGVALRSDQRSPYTRALPLNFAQVDGALEGCSGIAQAAGEDALNVRTAVGSGDVVGALPNGTPVQIMGVSNNGRYYRVQFLSGFGWVLSLGMTTPCADLPILPNASREAVYGALDVTAAELALLRPFFGDPPADTWFYPCTTLDVCVSAQTTASDG
jgi:hypothetical protein